MSFHQIRMTYFPKTFLNIRFLLLVYRALRSMIKYLIHHLLIHIHLVIHRNPKSMMKIVLISMKRRKAIHQIFMFYPMTTTMIIIIIIMEVVLLLSYIFQKQRKNILLLLLLRHLNRSQQKK